ncbi:MAG: DNA mismatch repair endonuclease MutH [Gammaproteobacteria bacterium]|nr:DNA mismatch repair endonuclease MutH [Gammaproteobacteria bacterium]
MSSSAPKSEEELLGRCAEIAGMELSQLARGLNVTVPANLRQHKGWVGQLLERALGASAGSLSEPDFQLIGVELKTLPLNRHGQPRESTYVCTVPLRAVGERWEDSWVRNKLSRVLWLPVESEPDIPLGRRRVGQAILWSPDEEQARILHRDWEELMEMISLGKIEKITAKQGVYLQIRPKAADSHVHTHAIGDTGEQVLTNPRGFYLRTRLTAEILNSAHRQTAKTRG